MAQHNFKWSTSVWFKIQRQLAILFIMVILAAIILPVVILILLPAILMLRLIVKLTATAIRPDLSEIFSGKGIVFATEPIYTRPRFNILLYLFCKSNNGPMPLEQLRLQFEQRVLSYTNDQGFRPYEKLTQTLTTFMGFIFWKRDENFKLANHIRLYDYTNPELALPAKCNEDNLKRVTGDLLARHWVQGQSPWELLIVPDYRTNQEAGSLVILRIHHSMVDGYGIFTMLLRFTNSLNVKRVLPNFPNPSTTERLTRPLLLLLKLPYDYAEFLVDSYDGPNCWHFPEKKLSRKYHVFFSDDIDVEKIKKIRKRFGLDYNSTVFSITCGSIRRLMLESGQQLPASFSVFVPFPQPNHPGGLGLPRATCFKFFPRIASAPDRIRQVGANLKTLKERPTGPIVNGWFMDILALFPAWLVRFVDSNARMTVGVTSIPGPEVEISVMEGTKMTSMWLVLGHLSNVGAVAAALTMAGKQRITLTVDKAIYEGFKVPTRFGEFVNQEIEQLLNTTNETRIAFQQ